MNFYQKIEKIFQEDFDCQDAAYLFCANLINRGVPTPYNVVTGKFKGDVWHTLVVVRNSTFDPSYNIFLKDFIFCKDKFERGMETYIFPDHEISEKGLHRHEFLYTPENLIHTTTFTIG